jgi:hypothetical protein
LFSYYFNFIEFIQVNLDDPDDHFQFKVYPCPEMEGIDGKRRYDGFFITVESDIRYYIEDANTEWYSCRIFSENQLLISTPAGDYDHVNSRDFIEREYNIDGDPDDFEQIDADALESIDVYNNRLNEDDHLQASRKLKYYILGFPRGVELSVKEIFATSSEDNFLDGVPITVRTFHENREGIMNTRTYVTWKVIDKARGSRKIGPGERKPISKIASKLGIGNTATKPNTAISTYKSMKQQVQAQMQAQMQQAQAQMQQQAQALAREMFRDWRSQSQAGSAQQKQGAQPDGVGSMEDA